MPYVKKTITIGNGEVLEYRYFKIEKKPERKSEMKRRLAMMGMFKYVSAVLSGFALGVSLAVLLLK